MHGTIEQTGEALLRAARDKADALPLAEFDVGHPELFRTDSF